MLEIRPTTPSDLEKAWIINFPADPEAQFINLVNSGRRTFMDEAVGEGQLGDLDLVPAYSPRERIGNLVSDSIVNLSSQHVGLSYIVFLVILFGSTVAVSCHPELLDRNGRNQQISVVSTMTPTMELPLVEPTPEWAIIADQIVRALQTPTPGPRIPKGAFGH